MTENPDPPSPPAAPACRKSWILVVGVLIVATAAAAAYIFRYESPASGFLASTAQSSAELTALEQKLASLESLLKETERSAVPTPTPTPTSSVAPLPADLTPVNEAIKKLEDRLADVENRTHGEQQDVRRLVSEAFAFWELREAARSDLGFESQLATLRAHAVNDPTVMALANALEPYAASGVPTVSSLRLNLARVEKETPLPTPAEAPQSLWKKMKALFQPLIAVRPEQDPRFGALERALDAGALTEALDAAKALPTEAQAPIAAWRAKLEARIVVDETLKALSAHFLETPATEKTP